MRAHAERISAVWLCLGAFFRCFFGVWSLLWTDSGRVQAVLSAAQRRRLNAIPVHLYGQCADMDAVNAIAAISTWALALARPR